MQITGLGKPFKKKTLPILNITKDVEFGKNITYYHLPGHIVVTNNDIRKSAWRIIK